MMYDDQFKILPSTTMEPHFSTLIQELNPEPDQLQENLQEVILSVSGMYQVSAHVTRPCMKRGRNHLGP